MSGCQESYDSRLKRECEEATLKFYPQQIAADIREDSLNYDIVSKTLTHYYTLTGAMDTLYDLNDQQTWRAQYVQAVKTDATLDEIRKHEINVDYRYFSDKSGEQVLRFTITKNDYK